MDLPSLLHQLPLEAVAAIVAGLVILLVPRILNFAVAAYLLSIGILGLWEVWAGQRLQAQPLIALVAGILILLRPNILSYVVGAYLLLIGILQSGVVRF